MQLIHTIAQLRSNATPSYVHANEAGDRALDTATSTRWTSRNDTVVDTAVPCSQASCRQQRPRRRLRRRHEMAIRSGTMAT